MRIQHNIMAMTAYRNYNTNTSALSKNLEKLSSGYKINRAGDDAAGLAISEKMRAQITGLDAAQKNVKDGISLVKTAEGAMQEVQDMLNRMDYLATQSANGTYDNEVDRLNLQKEVDALKDEINRIADSANFNGIKLLDGSLAETTTEADELGMNMSDVATKTNVLNILADGVEADSPAVKTKFELDLSQVRVINAGSAVDVSDLKTALAGVSGALEDADSETAPTTITYDLSAVTFDMPTDADGNVVDGGTIKFSFAGQEIEIKADSSVDTADNGGTADDKEINGKEMVAAIVAKFDGIQVDIEGVKFTVGKDAAADDKLVLKEVAAEDGSYNDDAIDNTTELFDITVTPGSPAQTTMNIEVSLGDMAGGTGKVLNGGTAITIGFNKTMTGNEIAKEFMNNLAASGTPKEIELNGIKFTVSNDNGKLTFEEKDDPTSPYQSSLVAALTVKDPVTGNAVAQAGGANNTAPSKNENNLGVTINQGESIGVNIVQKGKIAETRHMAQAELDLTKIGGIKDGTALKIGNETYIFAVGNDSEYKDSANVIDLTHKKADDADLAIEASRILSNVAKDNAMFAVTTDNVNGTVRLTERLNSGIDYKKNNLQGDTAANLQDADVKDWKDLIQVGIANPDAKPAVTSGGLTLQIGDTSDKFNQMRVKIGDMHTSGMGIADVNIGTQEGAADAIQTIKDAINYVSGIRGDLGAVQNRLEHTGNNLSVMAENIQDAESTIRDTDVANEMMSYVKNNILVQSAQAMLAQANQVPQGVLQLLG